MADDTVQYSEVRIDVGAADIVGDLHVPSDAAGVVPKVVAPTLLVVGGADRAVIQINKDAMQRMPAQTDVSLEIVPGAGHLFQGPGELEQVAQLAGDHFVRHLDG